MLFLREALRFLREALREALRFLREALRKFFLLGGPIGIATVLGGRVPNPSSKERMLLPDGELGAFNFGALAIYTY